MICKKCGREYEDDMLKCLWCDAPNDHHVPPEPPSRQDLSEVLDVQARIDSVIIDRMGKDVVAETSTEETEKKIAKHPVGDFMWSAAILATGGLLAAIGGAFLIAFFHRGEISKKLDLTKFTSAYSSSITAHYFLINGLAKETKNAISNHLHGDVAYILNKVLFYGKEILFICLCGYTAAFVLKRFTPDYEASKYKAAAKITTICSVPAVTVLSILTSYILET